MNPSATCAPAEGLIKVPPVTLAFWIAYILTRPFGAALGDVKATLEPVLPTLAALHGR